MSDPHILRFHSPLVASAFTTAFNSIEQLQTFIPPKAEKLCDCGAQTLVDSSIINNGIKHLVSLTLKKQLEPLLKPLPKIVSKEFKAFKTAPYAAEDENLVERQIKEANCMASIVLLYYYIQWHALLIFINSKVKGTQDRLEDEKLLATIAKLPRGNNLLELRHLNTSFKNDTTGDPDGERKKQYDAIEATGALDNLMSSNQHTKTPYLNRTTKLVTLYRRAIEKILSIDQPNTQLPTADTLAATIKQVRDEYAYNHTLLFGGVFSSFNAHEGTQKWEDMFKKLQVQTQDKDGHIAVFETQLKKILSALPYSDNFASFMENAVPLCIHDYNSSTLMLEITKSATQLSALIASIQQHNEKEIPQRLYQFASQFFAADCHKEFELKGDEYTNAGFQHNLFKNFIAEARNSFRANNGTLPYRADAKRGNRVTVDDFPAYYTGSGAVNIHNANHVYLALPGLEIDTDDTPFLKRIQIATATLDLTPDAVSSGIAPFIRNSLYTQYGIHSILALLQSTTNVTGYDLPGEYAYPAAELFQSVDTAKPFDKKTLHRADIITLLQKERDAYQQYLRQYSLQRPKLIPGISWPVSYTDVTGPKNNNAVFDLVRHVPKQWLGTTQEMVQQLHEISTKLPAPP